RPFAFPKRRSSHPLDESRPLSGEGNRRMIRITFWPLFFVLLAASGEFVVAQDSPQTPVADQETPPQISPLPQQFSSPPVDLKSLPKNLVLDQRDFWTAPLHFSHKQWEWTVPSLLIGGLLIKADDKIQNHVPTGQSTVSHAVTASNAGAAAFV